MYLIHSEWISILSKDTYKSFLRCAELGCTLHEQHLIVNSSVYMWNYHHDIIQGGVWISLIEEFTTLYQFIKQLPVIKYILIIILYNIIICILYAVRVYWCVD